MDLLESRDNVVTYYWTDSDGNEQGIDLDITVNEEGISSVKEKKSSDKELKTKKKSIEEKKSEMSIMSYPDVPFKLNGGSTRSQFANDHAFDRHKYDSNATSSCSRTRYARDIGVSSLRSSTVAKYDGKYHISYPASTVFINRYDGRYMNMRIADYGYTYYHRVLSNFSDPEASTHHPLCK